MTDHQLSDDQVEEAGKALKVIRQNLDDADWRARFKKDPKKTLEDAGIDWGKLPDAVRTVTEDLRGHELKFLADQVRVLDAAGLLVDETSTSADARSSQFATLCKF